ncbi:predicted nucleotidyltransferase [Bacillus oleivorans]|uniref:tRNA(Met) cytidine acetate ligase n=1 Tax=Bacillus oleivorans TaxID=1448271 RepID=A0A285D0N4_9BACI|nr:nucleotidyltransferase [Bacillus oleivorans]SNX73371.1 predicted nucleotidyltransferase [Bacillus oleivorans]
MKSAGVIVEYNPFHNGHLFHLNETKKITSSDVLIAVMSGNFLQRGEPALVSKWARTKMALRAGIDIVVELPYQFATQQAEIFANGAISILEALHCEAFAFGSESGKIDSFFYTFEKVEEKNQLLQTFIQEEVKRGSSYPKSVASAYATVLEGENTLDLSRPNNILGFHYIKALREQNGKMKPYTISRKNAQYHDVHFSSATIASATSIRKHIFERPDQNAEEIMQYVPPATFEELQNYHKVTGLFHSWELYWPYLQYRIQTASPEELRSIYEIEEGIEYRIKDASIESSSFHDFMNNLKTKRYTWTRLQRMCVHILTNTLKEEMSKNDRLSPYIRLLGMSKKGQHYLNELKKDLELPLIANVKKEHATLLHLDLKAAKVYNLPLHQHNSRILLEDFLKHPVLLKEGE